MWTVSLRDDASTLDIPEIHWLKLVNEHFSWALPATWLYQAIQAEQRAHDVAVRGDARSQAWVQQELDEAQNQLRLLRDLYFVGSQNSDVADKVTRAFDRLLGPPDQNAGMLGQLLATRQAVSRAYRVRDQIVRQLPEVMQWLVQTKSSPEASRLALRLIDDVHQLSQLLDAGPHADLTTSLAELESQRALVDEQGFAPLAAEIKLQARSLAEQNELSSADIPTVERLLGMALIAGEARGKLRQKYLQALRLQASDPEGLDANRSGQTPAGLPNGSEAMDPAPSAGLSADARRHPALALIDANLLGGTPNELDALNLESLDPAQRSSETRLRLAAIGGLVRARIAKAGVVLTDGASRPLVRTTYDTVSVADSNLSAARQQLAELERLARSAAPLISAEIQLEVDPCRALREADHGIRCWSLAQATLEDFWGPAQKGQYYFAELANRYWQAGRIPVESELNRRFQDLEQGDIQAAQQWVQDWNQLQFPDKYADELDDFLEYSLRLPTSSTAPRGLASFFVLEDGKRRLELYQGRTGDAPTDPARAYDIASISQELPVVLRVGDELGPGSALQVEGFYRGHVGSAITSLKSNQGPVLVFARPHGDPTSVTVSSDERQTSLVMFVLDCSYSMQAMQQQGGTLKTRLQIAKEALQEVVQNLDPKYHRVGLIAYGHRAQWVIADPPYARWKNDALKNRLTPGDDVELLVRLEPLRIRSGRVTNFDSQLANLEPYGVTPLYYAIRSGMDELMKSEGNVASRHLIVLTDGANNQELDIEQNPRSKGPKSQHATELASLEAR